ncbi:hypothetical protein ACN47E_004490 [Coniothyrium glycines]
MSRLVTKWTPEEDEILLQQVRLLSSQGKAKDWTAIASAVPGRSNKSCRKRWCNHLVGGLRKGPWDPSEDRRLAIGVKEYGLQWPLVAEEVGTRSADQCAKRWHHSLDPSLDHSKWSEAEEERLFAAVEKHGRAWKQIQTEYFPGRATNNVKNKYVVLTRKRKDYNSEDEEQDCSSSSDDVNGEPNIETHKSLPSCEIESNRPRELASHDDVATSKDRGAALPGDPFSLENYSLDIPPSMDLDINTVDLFTTDLPYGIDGDDFMTGLAGRSTINIVDSSYFQTDSDRSFSGSNHPESHTRLQFDSEMDPQSMLLDMNFPYRHRAKLVMTIENPSSDVVNGIMGVLVHSKSKFKMEMQ